ncbi:hypothetical protein [Catenuloplanes atrovinosus]|uniref:Uncharacterized protein n=1 Tax=Catenuloplanes atrovinosus TaxID=137266 RepID=A0AAE4CCW8_9ACTN|nr:hypothetical protein [Catenuloplanes atrovinosus]MDR7276945.1 hypothetical protein [Catenuloplanes atrovinosus]
MTAGWPVLVAAGRRRDYSAVLAPDFLVEARAYGVLTDSLRTLAPDDPPRVVAVPAGGVRLRITYAAHDVTSADLDDPGVRPGAPVRDEHGRPLRFLYGVAWREGTAGEPGRAELEVALGEARHAYRRFLADEEGFTVLPSSSFPLRTPVSAAPAAAPPPRPARRRTVVLLSGTLIALIALLVLLLPRGGGDPDPVCSDPARCSPSPSPVR